MSEAFLLLLVGMVTVVIALSFVVLVGNLIIKFINKFFPEEVKQAAKVVRTATQSIDSKKLAAIVAAIDLATKGSGKVVRVEKA